LVVGKTTDVHIETLIQEYQKRLTHYIPFALQVIPELKNTKALTPEQQKQAEGELILRTITTATDLILLDEHGKEFRSIEFSDYLQKKMSAGRDVVFVVGGPYGFSDAVYQRSNGKISLSKMTFSHQMVRLFFVEQVYRSMTILRGEPYHHE
jgi:23S rRNA (pseudouridine1915-N3)-methyltransferase